MYVNNFCLQQSDVCSSICLHRFIIQLETNRDWLHLPSCSCGQFLILKIIFLIE
jgi:hypothetical protein